MSLDLPPVTPIWRETTPPETPAEEWPLTERARLRLALLVPCLLVAAKLAWMGLLRLVPEPFDVAAKPLAVLIAIACVGTAIICGAVACCGDVPEWWPGERKS